MHEEQGARQVRESLDPEGEQTRQAQEGRADARGNGQSHAEGALQLLGSLLVSCIKATAQFYEEWFPKYKQAYEGRNFLVAMRFQF